MLGNTLWCNICSHSSIDCHCGTGTIKEPISHPVCPGCTQSYHVFCLECGEDLNVCSCLSPVDWYCGSCGEVWGYDPYEPYDLLDDIEQELDEELTTEVATTGCTCTPPRDYYCGKCGVVRNKTNEKWKTIPNNNLPSNKSPTTTIGQQFNYNSYGRGWSAKDRHYGGDGLQLPSGIKIYASSHDDKRKKEEFIPDWGLYLDWIWKPEWRHEHISWPDMSIPNNEVAAIESIIEAYEKALSGSKVEVGCIGGHGRTGTVLACMAVLEGVLPKEAINLVRDNYCTEAIETASQEWWIYWFSHSLFDTPLPPEPAHKSCNTQTIGCSKESHYIFWRGGHATCKKKGAKCEFWKADIREFDKNVSQRLIDHYDKWKKETLINVDGYLIPRSSGKIHSPEARKGCQCDLCRYRAKGFGAFLESTLTKPSTTHYGGSEVEDDFINVAQSNGSIIKVQISGDFRPRPPKSKETPPLGTVSGEYVYTKDGWVWERLSKVKKTTSKPPTKRTNKRSKKTITRNYSKGWR